MKILATTSGVVPAKIKAYYIIDMARRLDAEVLVLYIKKPEERDNKGDEAVKIFSNIGLHEHIPVITTIKKGEIIPVIINTADEESVDLIIMGASDGRDVDKWISAGVMNKTTIPVLMIPKAFNPNNCAFRSFIT